MSDQEPVPEVIRESDKVVGWVHSDGESMLIKDSPSSVLTRVKNWIAAEKRVPVSWELHAAIEVELSRRQEEKEDLSGEFWGLTGTIGAYQDIDKEPKNSSE